MKESNFNNMLLTHVIESKFFMNIMTMMAMKTVHDHEHHKFIASIETNFVILRVFPEDMHIVVSLKKFLKKPKSALKQS